jgi:hypothetical protein
MDKEIDQELEEEIEELPSVAPGHHAMARAVFSWGDLEG